MEARVLPYAAMVGALKYALTRAGALLPPGWLRRGDTLLDYLHTGRWMREHGFAPAAPVATRAELFARMAAPIAGREVLYLEFGVFRGESMRIWSRLLTHPRARLHGFDSFEGLPEAWTSANRKGHFSTGGALPAIDDPRVVFYKGWFEDTLARYVFEEPEALVVNIDADLYSSAACVLRALGPRFRPGTLLYFDEFSDRQHEQRAFGEFLAATGMRFELVGADHGLTHVAFRRC